MIEILDIVLIETYWNVNVHRTEKKKRKRRY